MSATWPGRLVEQYFQSDADFWKDVYSHSTVFGTVIQRRHAIALGWIDGLRLAPMAPVLEVGCGAGVLAVALAQRGLAIQALDPVPAMLAHTRRRAAEAGVEGRLRVRLGDAHALDFEAGTFQLVTALGVLPWLHDPTTAVGEMARVLKPGGWLIVNADNWASLAGFLDPLRNPVLHPLKRPVKRVFGKGNAAQGVGPRADRRRDVDRMLRRAQLNKIDGQTCGFGPLSIFRQRFVPDRVGVPLERGLQVLADHGVPGVRSAGWYYMVLARKADSR